jgi:hypothetical protein
MVDEVTGAGAVICREGLSKERLIRLGDYRGGRGRGHTGEDVAAVVVDVREVSDRGTLVKPYVATSERPRLYVCDPLRTCRALRVMEMPDVKLLVDSQNAIIIDPHPGQL